MTNSALIISGTLLLSAVLTLIFRRLAPSLGMLDTPNERSSHSSPTARGGGLAIVISVSIAAAFLRAQGIIGVPLLLVILIGGGAIAAVGFIDDRIALPASYRIIVHGLAAVFAIAAIGGMPKILWGAESVDLGLAGAVLGIIAIVWMLNLFNFMDGIDGIAASEAAFVAIAGAGLLAATGTVSPAGALALVVASASIGFLLLNWPPASIFMGDVGSGYLGYVLAVLAIISAREEPSMLYVWLILSGAFVMDATVTLIRRLLRGERIAQAHRSHAYQRLARRWNSHLAVTALFWAINVAWLLPCAYFCATHADRSRTMAVIALLPLLVVFTFAGAGESAAADRPT